MDGSDDRELMELTINYKGMDYTIVTDLITAQLLVNDQEAAEKHIETILEESAKETTQATDNECQVWNGKGKPGEKDIEATAFMLNLRKRFEAKFADKKSPKLQLWQKIGTELKRFGFDIGERPGEKCRQKFANLQKAYFAYIRHVKTTGEGARDPPPFFDELHDILGSKDKSNPKDLQDSLTIIEDDSHQLQVEHHSEGEYAEDEDKGENFKGASCSFASESSGSSDNFGEGTSGASAVRNRFSKISKSLRPKPSAATEIIQLLKEQHKADQEVLKEQNKQRREFLDLFRTLVEKETKRRRPERRASSEDD